MPLSARCWPSYCHETGSARTPASSIASLDTTGIRPLCAHPRRSRCLMLRPKPDVRSGSGLRLLEAFSNYLRSADYPQDELRLSGHFVGMREDGERDVAKPASGCSRPMTARTCATIASTKAGSLMWCGRRMQAMGVGRPERRLDRLEQGGVRLRIVEGLARRVEHRHAAFRQQEPHGAWRAVQLLGEPGADLARSPPAWCASR